MSKLDLPESRPVGAPAASTAWWRLLNRYHWFVLIVAALGWLFDCLDQQLFNLARVPAMRELLRPGQDVSLYGGYATSIFLIGWATGGLIFGVLGDRIGRARTMLFTILLYSLFTGLSAASTGFWDFAIYRFLTGLGVGGEFAVGVALVAEVMPDRARPYALGLLQALSAVGNITAAFLSMGLGHLEESGAIGSSWRWMFVIGAFPALLAVVIRLKLKEPERWQAAVKERGKGYKPGSYGELFGNPHWHKPAAAAVLFLMLALAAFFLPKEHALFASVGLGKGPLTGLLFVLAVAAGAWCMFGGQGDPRWRKNATVGLLMAVSGIIGLWGIGFFSVDLVDSVFRKKFESEARQAGEAAKDREFIQAALLAPAALANLKPAIQPKDLLSPVAGQRDAQALYGALLAVAGAGGAVSAEALLGHLDQAEAQRKPQTAEERERRRAYLAGVAAPALDESALNAHAARVAKRTKEINGRLAYWKGINSLMINVGAFFGMLTFSRVTQRIGRRKTFAVFFVLALVSTAMVFWYLREFEQIFWMIPIMGFCQLALFGGYAIYFPELFPTRLRSTGTSFCYNVGRFAAAVGPAALGVLTSQVFYDKPEPMRYAGLTMCGIFLLGLIVLPFAPETKDQPLPEEEKALAH